MGEDSESLLPGYLMHFNPVSGLWKVKVDSLVPEASSALGRTVGMVVVTAAVVVVVNIPCTLTLCQVIF